MKVHMRGTNALRDVARDVAETLIAAGLASEVKPEPTQNQICKATWRIFNTTEAIYPPTLHWNCASCSLGGDSSARDAARKPFRHGPGCSGAEEFVTEDVAARFEEAYKRFEKAHSKQPRRKEEGKRVFFIPSTR